ncbi:MAG: hypothetical protein R3244_10145, partial [Thermoanaerobaculia bacterium]|nr:hypothetical protein [Thermoanaerobaculia bacterium]
MFVFDDLITGSYSIRFIGGGYHPLFAAGQDQDGYYISTPSGTNLGPGDREWADQTMESIW